MKKVIKGNYGYLKAKMKLVIMRTILSFALPLAIFAIGYYTTKTKQNLLTIIAVLGCLPACKSLVSLIMYIRSEGCSENAYVQISKVQGRLIGMYDMFFTAYQKNFAISHLIVDDNIILCYTESAKCDLNAAREHLQTMLKQGGIKNMTISITDNLQKYCEQLQSRNEAAPCESTQHEDEARTILYDISL